MGKNFGPGIMGGVVLVDPATGQPYKASDIAVADLIDPLSPAGAALSATFARQVGQVVNVNAHVPAGTNIATTDCSSYFAAAIAAAGVNGTVEFSGQYRCDHELVMLNFQRLRGITPVFGTGGKPANCLDFSNIVANPARSNEKVGVRQAASNVFEDFLLWGPGDQTALAWGTAPITGGSSSPRFTKVSFCNWARGVALSQAYYTSFYDCSWNYNAVSVYADSCYNLRFYNPMLTCKSLDAARYGVGIQVAGVARSLNVNGGSIENYSTGIIGVARSQINVDGTYFETGYVGATGIDAIDAARGISLNVTNCLVYIINHTQFVKFTHMSASSLRGGGNEFFYSQIDPAGPDLIAAPTVPTFYAIASPGVGTTVTLADDNTDGCYRVSPNQTWGYTDNNFTAGNLSNYNIKFPYASWEHRSSYALKGRTPVYPFRVLTTSTTLLETDHLVLVNSASATTQKLPAVFAQVPGRTISIKNIGAGTVTVGTAEASGVTVETTSLTTGQSAKYMLYGGNWITSP